MKREELVSAIKHRRESIERAAEEKSGFLESSRRLMQTMRGWAESVPGLQVEDMIPGSESPWIKIYAPLIGSFDAECKSDAFEVHLRSSRNRQRQIVYADGNWYHGIELLTQDMFFEMIRYLLDL